MEDRDAILNSVSEPVISDPLSEVTRRERRWLLLLSLLGAAIARAGLIPTGIPAVGIELTPRDRLAFLYLIALVLFYFLFAFFVYSRSDLKRRKAIEAARQAGAHDFANSLRGRVEQLRAQAAERPVEETERLLRELSLPSHHMKIATEIREFAGVRIFFDCHLPLLLGASAISFLLYETRSFRGWLVVTPVLGAILLTVSAIYVKRNWSAFVHWLKVRRYHWYRWRSQRVTEKLKKSKADSKRHAKLAQKARDLLMNSLKGPWV